MLRQRVAGAAARFLGAFWLQAIGQGAKLIAPSRVAAGRSRCHRDHLGFIAKFRLAGRLPHPRPSSSLILDRSEQ